MQCHSVQPLYGVTFDDPKKFFERFDFEAAQIHEALHFDKLKQLFDYCDLSLCFAVGLLVACAGEAQHRAESIENRLGIRRDLTRLTNTLSSYRP